MEASRRKEMEDFVVRFAGDTIRSNNYGRRACEALVNYIKFGDEEYKEEARDCWIQTYRILNGIYKTYEEVGMLIELLDDIGVDLDDLTSTQLIERRK